jgi:23S rRNA (adenine2030-N6)-methyltransferase
MNYRHAFHAGNFADLLKHALLAELMAALTADARPLTVIDTHAGAGLYDLGGALAKKTGEAERGIAVLMADEAAPTAFDRLKAAVARANRRGEALRFYPGSPLLIAHALRPRDTYIACEIRADDNAALRGVLPREAGVQVLKADGWRTAVQRTPAAPARAFVLIDPPFEAPGDHAAIVGAASAVLRRNPGAVIAAWLPIKDLAGWDAFLGDLEDCVGRAPLLVAEARLRPLSDPMKMNGCALAVINPPPPLTAAAESVAEWIAGRLGEAGAAAKVFTVS